MKLHNKQPERHLDIFKYILVLSRHVFDPKSDDVVLDKKTAYLTMCLHLQQDLLFLVHLCFIFYSLISTNPPSVGVTISNAHSQISFGLEPRIFRALNTRSIA